MARKNITVLKIDELSEGSPWALRYRFEDEALRASLQKYGVLTPLIVTEKGTVVAGHKRVRAARAMGLADIPAFVLETKVHEQENLLMIFLISNWQQNLMPLDAAWMLKGIRESLNVSEQVILTEIMPLLGLRGEKHVLTDCLETVSLAAELLQCIDAGSIPFRGAKVLGLLSAEDQRDFAQHIVRKTQLTTNQVLQSGEWLYDLIKIEEVPLEKYLVVSKLKTILEDSHLDRRQRSERFVSALRRIRFPALVGKEDQFKEMKHQIDLLDCEVAVEMNPFFEDQGYLLKAKLRTAASLGTLESLLREKRELLNSLFDIML